MEQKQRQADESIIDEINSISEVESDLDREAHQEKLNKFNTLVMENKNLIYSLCIKYTDNRECVEENYAECLLNFWKYINTYNSEYKIQTWLHIITKRFVFSLNKKRHQEMVSDERVDVENIVDTSEDCEDQYVSYTHMDEHNYMEFMSDDMQWALEKLKPIYRDALILQVCGYTLKEIVEMCYEKGTLKNKNIETIKSRLLLAKQEMRKYIDRDGNRRLD